MSFWLRVLALVLLSLAVIVALGSGTVEHAAALLPGGLLAWCAAETVGAWPGHRA